MFFANALGHPQGAEILTGQATFLRAVSKRQFFARERHLHPLSTYIWVGQAIFIVNLVILWLNRVIFVHKQLFLAHTKPFSCCIRPFIGRPSYFLAWSVYFLTGHATFWQARPLLGRAGHSAGTLGTIKKPYSDGFPKSYNRGQRAQYT